MQFSETTLNISELVQLCINLGVIVLDIRVSCASLNRRRSGLRLG